MLRLARYTVLQCWEKLTTYYVTSYYVTSQATSSSC